MKKQIGIFLILATIFSSTAFAGSSINEINALIDAHGKKNLVNFIRKKSGDRSVTIEIDNKLIINLNTPPLDHITAKSIQNDFNRLGITIEDAYAGTNTTEDDNDEIVDVEEGRTTNAYVDEYEEGIFHFKSGTLYKGPAIYEGRINKTKGRFVGKGKLIVYEDSDKNIYVMTEGYWKDGKLNGNVVVTNNVMGGIVQVEEFEYFDGEKTKQ